MWTQANDSSNEPVAKIQTARQRSAGCYLFFSVLVWNQSCCWWATGRTIKMSGQTKVVPPDEQPRSPSLVQQCANREFIFSCLLNIYMKRRNTEVIATTHSSVISLHVSQHASAMATARAWMAACASSAVTSPQAPTARPACLVIMETQPTEANARVSSQCAQHGSPCN